MTPRRRRALNGVLLAVLLVVAVAAIFHRPLLRLAAEVLVVNDPPQHADAIVVVAGGTPSREAVAADLFREGWAPRVVVSRPYMPPEVRELNTLGVRPLDLQAEARVTLEKYGVPADRIVSLGVTVMTTEPELAVVHDWARAAGDRRVILVTSSAHTRRVQVIWSRESRQSHIEGLVVAAPSSEFAIDDWWHRRRAAEALLHEYLGLLAIYLGISPLLH
jgi:uncharacterized SAM-binding protein YcdF (DUF218 family)